MLSVGSFPVVAYLLILVAFVAAQSWWSWSTRRMLLGFGVASGVLRHWTKRAFLGLTALSFCCGLAQVYADPFPAQFDREQWPAVVETAAVSMAIRVLALALLLCGIWAVRADIRRWRRSRSVGTGPTPTPAGPRQTGSRDRRPPGMISADRTRRILVSQLNRPGGVSAVHNGENTLHCTKCGTALEHAGQGHTCRSSAPPPALRTTGWEVATWFVVGFGVLFALAGIASAVLGSALNGQYSTVAAIGVVLAGLVLLAAIVGLVVSGLIWARGTRQIAEAYGSSGRAYSRHWGTRIYSFCLVLSVGVSWLAADRTAPAVLFTQATLRTLGAAALIGGVLHSRARILRLIAQANQVGAGHVSPVAAVDPAWPLNPTPTSDDWNAGQWDPDVLRDIEARRHRDRT